MTFWIGLSWLAVAGSFATLLGVVVWMLVRQRQTNVDVIDGALDDSLGFKIESYRPMERLLADEDLIFLQSQPGYRREMGERWKRERRRIFRLYFKELKRDFRRLHAEARGLVARADADSADLVRVLMHQRWTFLRATAHLEFRLALAWVGIGKVDAAPLIELMEAMRANVSRLGAVQAA
jgi:hypothetical protein